MYMGRPVEVPTYPGAIGPDSLSVALAWPYVYTKLTRDGGFIVHEWSLVDLKVTQLAYSPFREVTFPLGLATSSVSQTTTITTDCPRCTYNAGGTYEMEGVTIEYDDPMDWDGEVQAPTDVGGTTSVDSQYDSRLSAWLSGALSDLVYGSANFPIVSELEPGKVIKLIVAPFLVTNDATGLSVIKLTVYEGDGDAYEYYVSNFAHMEKSTLGAVGAALLSAEAPPGTVCSILTRTRFGEQSLGLAVYAAALGLPSGPLLTGIVHQGNLKPIQELELKQQLAVDKNLPLIYVGPPNEDTTAVLLGTFSNKFEKGNGGMYVTTDFPSYVPTDYTSILPLLVFSAARYVRASKGTRENPIVVLGEQKKKTASAPTSFKLPGGKEIDMKQALKIMKDDKTWKKRVVNPDTRNEAIGALTKTYAKGQRKDSVGKVNQLISRSRHPFTKC